MAGMSGRVRIGAGLLQGVTRVSWELARAARRFDRRFGLAGWVVIAGASAAASAWTVEQQQFRRLAETQQALVQRAPLGPAQVDASGTEGRSRLAAFDELLPPQAELPDVVASLLRLAEAEHLLIARGDYRPQADARGKYLRYRMTLPVKGDAQAVHRFMQAALREHRTLAIEGVQFKRERVESPEVEARIQWVVLARLHPQGDDLVPDAGTTGGRK